jgi:hypothetical protein
MVSVRTNSKEQSPSWGRNRSSATRKTPRILWKTKVYYRVHKSPPPVTILNKIGALPPSHFCRIHFNIILPRTLRSSKWFPSLRFPHKIPVCNSAFPTTCYMPRPLPVFWWCQYFSRNVGGTPTNAVKKSEDLYLTFLSLSFARLWQYFCAE